MIFLKTKRLIVAEKNEMGNKLKQHQNAGSAQAKKKKGCEWAFMLSTSAEGRASALAAAAEGAGSIAFPRKPRRRERYLKGGRSYKRGVISRVHSLACFSMRGLG